MPPKLKAPFPYFGGKSKVAPLVWQYLGDVDNYIEGFCGSASVLLNRPHPGKVETVNDFDCYVSNFWRATLHEPEKVARYADWPVNECDLHARHKWLVLSEYASHFRMMMRSDPSYYDARVAGWWVHGACCWIGSGWCVEPQQMPHISNGGQGINTPQQMPHMDAVGRGVATGPAILPELNGKREELSIRRLIMSSGCQIGPGVNSNIDDTHRPQLADAFSRGRGVNGNDHAGTCEQRLAWLTDWMQRLRDRLRTVRVCCGDWIRVCDSPSTTTRLGLTGIFLDPPYRTSLEDGKSNRSAELYASDRDSDVNALVDRVQAYCLERGSDPQIRIAVCGYEGEGYEALEQEGWQVEAWKASGGYGNQSGKVNENAGRERIWFSPYCVGRKARQPLFEHLTGDRG